jgi:hypothetical protein
VRQCAKGAPLSPPEFRHPEQVARKRAPGPPLRGYAKSARGSTHAECGDCGWPERYPVRARVRPRATSTSDDLDLGRPRPRATSEDLGAKALRGQLLRGSSSGAAPPGRLLRGSSSEARRAGSFETAPPRIRDSASPRSQMRSTCKQVCKPSTKGLKPHSASDEKP